MLRKRERLGEPFIEPSKDIPQEKTIRPATLAVGQEGEFDTGHDLIKITTVVGSRRVIVRPVGVEGKRFVIDNISLQGVFPTSTHSLRGRWAVTGTRKEEGTPYLVVEPADDDAGFASDKDTRRAIEAAKDSTTQVGNTGSGGVPKVAGHGGPVHVSGYTRRDGTYVQPYTRRR